MTVSSNIMPFLKWVGGKRQLIPEILKHVPQSFSTYYEPFVGGGAVLFRLQPAKAVINDYNAELINVYKVIRNHPEALLSDLSKHKNEAEYYYYIRGLDRSREYKQLSKIERASRIIYLNKTCYNGLFRVNSMGEFNTPFGRYKNPNICNEPVIKAVSNYLSTNDIRIHNTDYTETLKTADAGSFVYLDPPYHPLSGSSNFTGYVQSGFNEAEQIRLRDTCIELNERGVKFLLSNSATDFIVRLYGSFEMVFVKANRHINSVPHKRGSVHEILVKNYL